MNPFHPAAEEDFDDEADEAELELDDECFDVLAWDDDYEPLPEPGDFWTEQDAA
jgi:hypothetical protein